MPGLVKPVAETESAKIIEIVSLIPYLTSCPTRYPTTLSRFTPPGGGRRVKVGRTD